MRSSPALGGLGLLSACSSSAAASGKDSFALNVGFISNTRTETGPEGWAYKSGALLSTLKPVGVSSVTFINFANGPNLMAALEGGSLDLGLLGDTPAVSGTANGVATRLVNQSFIGLDTWLYTAKDGPSTIEDLAGKTVSTQVGSYMYRYLVTVLREKGIYDSVKVTHVYTTSAVPAMQSGEIAAYAAPAGQTTALLSAAGLAAIKAKGAAYYSWAATAEQTPAADVRIATQVSGYPTAAFTVQGLALLNGVNSFLVGNKLTKSPLDISSWEVPRP